MPRKTLILSLLLLGIITSCKKDSTAPTTGVPNVAVSFSIPLNGGGYTNLLTVGGWLYIANTGYDGLVLFCNGPNTYLAFDRGCPYDCETNSKAIITIQATGITAVCPVCGTTYNLYSGTVTKGPGGSALKQYQTSFDAATMMLSVTN